jgi:hypothetical protein
MDLCGNAYDSLLLTKCANPPAAGLRIRFNINRRSSSRLPLCFSSQVTRAPIPDSSAPTPYVIDAKKQKYVS